MFMVDGGYASVHDSYLTPITYDGFDLGLSFEAMRGMRAGQWLWQLQVGADYNHVENPAGNNDLHKLMGDLSFNMQRCWRDVFTPKLNFSAGPMAQLRAGIVYDEVNSNNPVTVRAHGNLGVTGSAWLNTRLGRMPVTLRYQAQLPVLGAVFVGYSAAVVENDNAAVDVIDSVADSDVVDVKKSVSSEGDYYEQA